jgi:hypothetical protein
MQLSNEIHAITSGAGAMAEAASDDLLEQSRRKAEGLFEANRQAVVAIREAAAKKEADIPEEELQRRAEHLRTMRDALRAKKKAERESAMAEAQQLQQQQQQGGNTSVQTALANARSAFAADGDVNSPTDGGGNGSGGGGGDAATDEEKRMAMRLALAAKIKRDVINNAL